MQDLTDAQLLRDYTQTGNEAAFREIVIRHADLIYSSAVRQTRSPDLAQDVAQSVFTDLARKAPQLAKRLDKNASLLGWLYRSVRFAALNQSRDDRRRRARERQAMEILDPASEPASAWECVSPILDEAMADLSDADRDVLLLRFFKNQKFQEIGRSFNVSDDAAQKRVNRALDRLRAAFSRRGVSTTAIALSTALSANAVLSAPASLAATLAAGALTETTFTTIATATITMTTLQKIVIVAALATTASLGLYEHRRAATLENQVQVLQPAFATSDSISRQLDEANHRVAELLAENTKLHHDTADLLRLRSEITTLRGKASPSGIDPTETAMKSWLVRVEKLKQRVAESPESKIPEFRLLNDEDYMNAIKGPLNTEGDYLQALGNLRSAGEFRFISSLLNPALTQYAQANNGKFPGDLTQLQPYFPSPVEDAILNRWEIVPAKTVRTDNLGDPIITQKAAVDEDWDPRYAVGLHGFASAGRDTAGHNGWGVISPEIIMGTAVKAYQAANNGQQPSDPSQILAYLTTPEQQAAYQKLMKWKQAK